MLQVYISILLSLNLHAQERAGEVFDPAVDGRIDASLHLANDNLGSANGGDDYGHTHSARLAVGKEIKGLYVEINYESSLYTKLGGPGYIYITADGDSQYDLFYTEENAIRLILSNLEPGNKVYWRVGLGWAELNSEDSGSIFTATGQQEFVHRLIKKFDRRAGAKPIYLHDGLGERESLEIMAALGLQYEVNFGPDDRFRFRSQIEYENAQSGLPDADYDQVTGRADLFYQKSPKKMGVRAGVETRVRQHSQGTQTSAGLVVGVGRNNWVVEGRADKIVSGEIHNYQIYNTDKETIYSIEYRHKFGR